MANKIRNFFLDEEPPKVISGISDVQNVTMPEQRPANAEVSIQFDPTIKDVEKNRELLNKVLSGEGMTQDQLFEYVKANPDSARKIIGKYAPRDNDENYEANRYSKELITALDQGNFDEVRKLATPEQVPPPAAATDQPQTGGFKYLTPEEIKQQIAENRTNPLLAMIKANEPKIDEKQQERLRRIAAINSVGQGLGTILQGYYGKRGANIPVTQNNLLPEVYRQYMENQKNYETRLEANRAQQLAAQMQGLDLAQGQIAQERQLKAADERTKAGQAFQKEQQGAAWEQQEKMAKIQFDQQLTMFDKQAQKEMERMAQQRGYQKALQAMSQAFQASEAKKSRDFQSDLYEKGYKGKPGSGSWRGQNAGGAFVYVDKSGQKKILNPGQDEWIDYVLTKVMSDRTKYYRNKDMLDKYAQGKITENEARQIMSQYADEYLDINNGIAAPKGQAVESQTGGAY